MAMKLTSHPLSSATYDVIALIYRKSQIFEDYQRCLDDVRDDTLLTQLLIQMRHDDERHLGSLKAHLGRLLHAEGGSSSLL
jgi:hypothetical protein